MTVKKIKNISAVLLTILYDISCGYAVLYCSYAGILPIHNFFLNSAQNFRKYFLLMDEGSGFLFVTILAAGFISVIILTILHKNKAVGISMLIYVIQFFIVYCTLSPDSGSVANGHAGLIQQVYWLMIISYLVSCIYLNIFTYKKIFKNSIGNGIFR